MESNVARPPTPEVPCLITATKEVVIAYVANNILPDDKVAGLMEKIHATFEKMSGVNNGQDDQSADTEFVLPGKPVPAVPIRRSIQDGYLICLEDGRQLKVLTRHLASKYDMTPDEYRAKWGLPSDYPMAAPEYSRRRSEMALKSGLGRGRKRVLVAKTK